MAGLALLLCTAALSYIAVACAKRWALVHGIMDIPNARSSHTRAMPRAGGMGMVAAFVVAFVIAVAPSSSVSTPVWVMLLGALSVAAIGLIDDLRHLSARARFLVHLVAAVSAVAAGVRVESLTLEPFGTIPLGPLGGILSVLWLVGVTNIYNFMDGIDGIAAGVAVLASAGLAIIASLRGDALLLILACGLCGSASGFLAHNFPPARVFMGDVGSGFLGFTLAGLVLMSDASIGTVSIVASFALLAPFLLDGIITLLRRVVKGERWYEAHRSHYYQRLVILGYSHRTVSLLYYGLTVIAGLGAVAYVVRPDPFGLLALTIGAGAFVCLAVIVPRLEARPPQSPTSHP